MNAPKADEGMNKYKKRLKEADSEASRCRDINFYRKNTEFQIKSNLDLNVVNIKLKLTDHPLMDRCFKEPLFTSSPTIGRRCRRRILPRLN